TDDIFTKVSNNPNVEKYGIIEQGEAIAINDIAFTEYYMDKGAIELLKYSIKEGRMPENESEMAVEQWSGEYIKEGIKIGDTININNEDYKVVGFLKNDENGQKEKQGRVITFSNSPQNGQLMVEISEKADFKETLKTLTALTTKENLIRNDSLIRLNEFGSNRVLMVAAIVGVLIVLSATIIVIYNSFQINVAERVKQFGLLRSLGATKKQIRKIVFREATILILIAIPIGIIISIGAIYGINYAFKFLLEGSSPISLVHIDLVVIILGCIITTIAVYISSFIPAHFVGNISPLVAVSNRTVIKKEVIKRRKYPLLKKIFNYKVVMAIKNIRRNPARGQAMILSIVVSSALFITFTSFIDDVFTVKGVNTAYENIDLGIAKSYDSKSEETDKTKIISEVSKIGNIDKVYLEYDEVLASAEIPNDKRVVEAGSILKKEKGENGYKNVIDVKMKSYDNVALEEINKKLTSGTIDLEKMKNENGVILVDNGKARDKDSFKLYVGKLTNYKINDEIKIFIDGKEFKFKILGIVKDDIFEREDSVNSIGIITSKDVIQKNTDKEPKIQNINLSLKDKSSDIKTSNDINNILKNYDSYSLINYIDINESQKSSMIMIQVLVYGFISVIALISSINIINTITMNITLRRKESAMLKSIGMSQKDLKQIIAYEGLFYGIFGGVLGAIIGCALSYTLYDVISEMVSI
ncbi:MAG: ABC transporter permease, partial [Clostridium sp.]